MGYIVASKRILGGNGTLGKRRKILFVIRVLAGTDMALGFVSDQKGKEVALATAKNIEYLWNDNPEADPFSVDMG